MDALFRLLSLFCILIQKEVRVGHAEANSPAVSTRSVAKHLGLETSTEQMENRFLSFM